MSASATDAHDDADIPDYIPQAPAGTFDVCEDEGDILVVPLQPPLDLGSALERCAWDMFYRGLGVVDSDRLSSAPVSPVQSVRHIGDAPHSPTTTTSTAYDSDAPSMSSRRSEGTPLTSDVEGGADSEKSDGDDDALFASAPGPAPFLNFPGDGKYVRLSERNPVQDLVLTAQVYTVQITVKQDPGRTPHGRQLIPQGHHTPFKTIPDTANEPGSNSTWVAGYQSRRLYTSPDHPLDASLDVVDPRPHRPDTENIDSAIIEYPDRFADPLPPGIRCGRVRYMDGLAALLVKDVRTISFSSCVQWDNKSGQSRASVLTLRGFAMGVASAMTSTTRFMYAKGILGLGPSSVQDAYDKIPGVGDPRSFLSVVGSKIPRKDGDNTRVTLHVSMCNCETPNPRESWLSFNGWPTTHPLGHRETLQWSKPIGVYPGYAYGQWDVSLVSLSFMTYRDGAHHPLKNGYMKFPGLGLPVSLDSGCSASWVSADLVHFIRTSAFPTADNLRRHEEQKAIEHDRGTKLIPYTVPRADYSIPGTTDIIPFKSIKNWCIEYTFRGRANEPDVVVRAPLVPFICAAKPGEPHADREGLLFPSKFEASVPGRYLFGVNFFQSMYTQFNYHPDISNSYVRMAPQWNAMRKHYGLPPSLDMSDGE